MDRIEYDFYENPNSKSDNSKSKYHIRICRRQKISTKSMANRLSKYTTLTPADIYATITALQDAISGELGEGNIVVLDGICQFEITLGTENGVVDGLENGRNVVLKSVNIRPLPEFVDMVKEALKPRVKSSGFHSDRISDAEIENGLADYLKENESITRSVVEQKFHINRTRAARILKRLVQEGKLKNIGFSNHPKYVAVEDNTSESINNENVL